MSCLAAGAALFLLLRLMIVAEALPAGLPSAPPPTVQLDGNSDGLVDVIILMERAADFSTQARMADVEERRGAIIAQLKAVAEESQTSVLTELHELEKTGRVRHVRSFWIINGVAAAIEPALIPELAALPGVANVVLDARHEAFGDPVNFTANAPDANLYEFAGWSAPPSTGPGQAAHWSIDAIGAPAVWNLLGIDGQGITVAIVDTGVDWQHPALRHNYRGGRGESAVHDGHWYSTVYPTQTVPVDYHGHGTHVAGTAVGHKGIGVAPGADWIAVAIADEHGRIRDSDVHAAFEWLLAPGGDPALAPDVVNNSWGASGNYTAFLDDVRVLEAAGIVAVFAAGNNGPAAGSINAPASYPGAISVAAEDATGAVAWFSSRGPSPLTTEPKPLLSAPGAQILSAYPDNRYALMNGTSMATPHVTGIVAMMLSAEPRLTPNDVQSRLVAAAGHPVHDPDRGWGVVDAYAAIAPLAPAGVVAGHVASASGAIVGATITVTTPAGQEVRLHTDAQGRFEAAALSGSYRLQAEAFGYFSSPPLQIDVTAGHVVARDIQLEPLPAGTLSLQLVHAETGEHLEGDLLILTPAGRKAPDPVWQADGRYAAALPAGSYLIEARVPGFRLAITDVTIAADQTTIINLVQEPGPRLLLIDSGSWQYRSQADYYEQALADNGYFADRWPITNPFTPLPSLQHLAAYDALLWSAPYDSPGYLGANDVITDYLGLGGRLLITGQNVGNYDGADGAMALWWSRHLEADWLADASPDDPLNGAPNTPFAALHLTLNGTDSAGNQTAPDRTAPRAGSLTEPVLIYPDGSAAALMSRRCEPFRLLYFGFGLEGVTGRAQRAALMQASLDALLGPDDPPAALWQPSQVVDFAPSGEELAYTTTLRNLNPVLTTTFAIEAEGGWWPRAILSPTLTIPPCGAANTVLTLQVPPGLPPNESHAITLSARAGTSAVDAYPAGLTFTHKTPGHVLIVDDDRFINAESTYKKTFDQLGIEYDVWETGWPLEQRGSPSAAFLAAYEVVVWFTGYDWFQPLTDEETEALTLYLEQGGRLFLSSQDFLFRHYDSPLTGDYLGVASYQESITPTLVYFDEQLGFSPPLVQGQSLNYGAYQNFSDGLAPTAEARPLVWHNQGAAAGLLNSGMGASGRPWRAVFWALPFETLPSEQHEEAMSTVLGSLSDLGDSNLTVDRRSGPENELRVYKLSVTNQGSETRRVWVTNTLPISLTLHRADDRLNYNRAKHQLVWSGMVAPGEEITLAYTAALSSINGHSRRIDNNAVIAYAPLRAIDSIAPFDHLQITRTATTWIDAPDLTGSTLSAHLAGYMAPSPEGPVAAQLITYTLVMRNNSEIATSPISATLAMPQSLAGIEETLTATQGLLRLEAWRAVWQGSILAGDTVTVSVTLTRTAEAAGNLPAVAYLSDGETTTTLHPVFFNPLPNRMYLPVLGK